MGPEIAVTVPLLLFVAARVSASEEIKKLLV